MFLKFLRPWYYYSLPCSSSEGAVRRIRQSFRCARLCPGWGWQTACPPDTAPSGTCQQSIKKYQDESSKKCVETGKDYFFSHHCPRTHIPFPPELSLYVNLGAKGGPKCFKTLAPQLTVLDIPYFADAYSRTVHPIDLHNF